MRSILVSARLDTGVEEWTSRNGQGESRQRKLAVLDFCPPYGVRDLARRASIPLSSLSRTLDLLDREGLLTRDDHGAITGVEWEATVRRWTKDYEFARSNRVRYYLEPRGLNVLATKLGDLGMRYAATGGFAAQRFAPVAPARQAALYVDDPGAAVEKLGLRPAETGANVVIAEPFDLVVFERSAVRDGLNVVAVTQLAADLLTGPGGSPPKATSCCRGCGTTRMLGVLEPLYVHARAALLDAAQALGPHLGAVVLVGAQAIHLHTGDAELAVAEYTTDFVISPLEMAGAPLLDALLHDAGFTRRRDHGAWLSPAGIDVDLMVPEALAGAGTRGARLGPHGKRVARRAKGLEGTLVDRDKRTIPAIDPEDSRQVSMWVAGPGALLVAKVHKIAERVGTQDRVSDKDALDVLRLLRAVDTEVLANLIRTLIDHELAGPVTEEALSLVPELFADPDSDGVRMAVRAAGGGEDADTIAASLVALVDDLRQSLA